MNRYILFDKTQEAFDEIFKEINSAKKSIYIESYKILNDKIGRKLIDLLLKKSKQDIKVTIICDYLGWGNFSKKRIKKINESSIKLYVFNSFFKKINFKRIKKYWNIHFRDHRKLTIIDQKKAFVGGMNYSQRELKWKDMMVKIEGKILDDLLSAAKEMIGIAKKDFLERRHLYKKLSKHFVKEDIIVRQVPYSRHRLLRKELIKIFNKAEKEILMVTPYLVVDLPFKRALNRAIKRGVKIKIIIPKKSDNWLVDHLNHFSSYISKTGGIDVFLYPKMIHSKYLVIDNKITCFGSANLDYQTFNHNYELSVISTNKKLIKQMKESFDSDLSKSEAYHEKLWSKLLWINRFIMNFLLKYKRHF